jgi:hypothetical protein
MKATDSCTSTSIVLEPRATSFGHSPRSNKVPSMTLGILITLEWGPLLRGHTC